MPSSAVLVTGATGYVGGRLVPHLLKRGHRVRAAGRSAAKLASRPWAGWEGVETVQTDVLDRSSLARAVAGCRAVYYLVHSMNPGTRDFAETDRLAAENMAGAAAEAGVQRIIYLGGLGEEGEDLSEHLRSRREVGEILASGPVPTTFLRAAVVLGSGSASFEILRYLVERLPVMVTPRWVETPCQPIGIRNVIGYLAGCLENDETTGGTFDIGGPDVLTYRRLMEIYAEEAGLPRRLVVPVPLLTPRLSSYWIHFVTPVPSSIARPLVEGLRTPVLCRENRIRDLIPQDLLSCRRAIGLALDRIRKDRVDTCWSDAGALRAPEWIQCGDPDYAGGTVLECGHRVVMSGSPADVWPSVERIGGHSGWYFANILWRLRGALDRFLGGIGHRRGRRHSTRLSAGDALDFWRVLEVCAPHRLLLLAEMKMPGEAVLEFRLHDLSEGRTELIQQARYRPKGLLGLAYWYALVPLHAWLYRGMLRKIAASVRRPVLEGPERLAPRRGFVCGDEGGRP
ncbi:MAG: SDR family oxidoreductase [Deltaproteobacteria bacterium]|nr:SDR family oxidoreductase [Deltaproteobacteria bacterium]